MKKHRDVAQSSVAFDWVMGVLCCALVAGVVQDGWAHNHGKVDESFFTPWHAMLYGAMALNGIVLGIVGLQNLSKGYAFRNGLPYGYWLSLIGVFLFAVGGGLDLLWHSLFGIEEDINALVSPTHITLAFAAALVCSGPIRSIAHRFGSDEGGWSKIGPAVLGVTASLVLIGFFTQYAQPIADDGIAAVIAKSDTAPAVQGLYAMHADGSDQRRLFTTSDADLYGPSVSPDGKELTYRVEPGGASTSDIFVARIDGSHARRITHSGRHDTQPVWSPDGKWIAYISEPAGTSGDFELRTVRPDGTPGATILAGLTTVSAPSWARTPQGSRIAVASRNGVSDEIESIDTGPYRLTRWLPETADGTTPAWSPDGTHLAFVKEDATGGNDSSLAVTDMGGSAARIIATGGARDPAWSPDGRRIAFVTNVHGTAQVMVANANGRNPVDVTRLSAIDAARPAWSRNGDIIFVASGRASADQSGYALGLSLAAMLIQAMVVVGAFMLVVRRWRAPLGTITVIVGLFALAMATQNDDYFAVPAAIIAGLVGDVKLAWLGDRARRGTMSYVMCAAVPALLTALYLVFLNLQRGLGWPPNMIFGSPVIAGIAGLMIAFAYDSPITKSPAPSP